MKNFKNIYLLAGALALCSVGFVSCDDDDEYDFNGDAHNRVYTLDFSKEGKIVKTPLATIGALECNIPVKCSQKAKSDISASFIIDNTLIDEYNSENGTDYVQVPEGVIIVENENVTIPKGEMVSSESFIIRLTDDQNTLNSLSTEATYLVPVKLYQASGSNVALANSHSSTSYFVISVTEELINSEGSSCTGTLLSIGDRSGWDITYANNEQSVNISGIANAFDDYNYRNFSANSNGAFDLIIDMGRVYTFDGILSSYYGYQSASGTEPMYYSEDGNNWNELGASQSVNIYLYAPISARYIKYHCPIQQVWGGAQAYTYISNFNIYAIND